MKNILHKSELFDQLTKWAMELSEYDITYQPCIAIKSQVLVDFIANFTPNTLLQVKKELLYLIDRPPQSGCSHLTTQDFEK